MCIRGPIYDIYILSLIRPILSMPITTEPIETNEVALDLDLYSQPARRAAIDSLTSAWKPVVTERIRLAQEVEENGKPLLLLLLCCMDCCQMWMEGEQEWTTHKNSHNCWLTQHRQQQQSPPPPRTNKTQQLAQQPSASFPTIQEPNSNRCQRMPLRPSSLPLPFVYQTCSKKLPKMHS